jgi:hypothetical protein
MSEAEAHWRSFLESLLRRGMKGVRRIVSDQHSGIQAASKAVLPLVPWQGCQLHLMHRAFHYLPKPPMRKEEAKDLRAIFLSKDKYAAQEELHRLVTKYWTKAPSYAGWPEKNVPEVWRSSNSRPSIAAPSDPSRPTRIRKRMGDRKEPHVHPLVKPTRIQQNMVLYQKEMETGSGFRVASRLRGSA